MAVAEQVSCSRAERVIVQGVIHDDRTHRAGWDPALAPMASLENHIHQFTYFVVVEAGGLIRFATPTLRSIVRMSVHR